MGRIAADGRVVNAGNVGSVQRGGYRALGSITAGFDAISPESPRVSGSLAAILLGSPGSWRLSRCGESIPRDVGLGRPSRGRRCSREPRRLNRIRLTCTVREEDHKTMADHKRIATLPRISPDRTSTRRRRRILLLLLVAPLTIAAQDGESGWASLEVAGRHVAPGETARLFVDLAGTVGGQSRMLDPFLVVTRGTRPGPTLCLTAGIYGDEWNGMEIAHRIYAGTNADGLSGTLIAVPAVNMQGMRNGSRYLPDRRDLNRAFPGNPEGSLASRIAHALFQGVIRQCNSLIDLHTGSASRTNLPQIRTDLESPEALALARSFGVGVVLHGRGPEGSLRRSVLDAGVPAVIYEAGEPLRFEESEIERGISGISAEDDTRAASGSHHRDGCAPVRTAGLRALPHRLRSQLARGLEYPSCAFSIFVRVDFTRLCRSAMMLVSEG